MHPGHVSGINPRHLVVLEHVLPVEGDVVLASQVLHQPGRRAVHRLLNHRAPVAAYPSCSSPTEWVLMYQLPACQPMSCGARCCATWPSELRRE